MARCKRAELVGEQMLTFRSGDSLFPYCYSCVNSARTPVTGILGCSIGDRPDVVKYSDDLTEAREDPKDVKGESEEVDSEQPKCPGFLSSEQAKVSSLRDDFFQSLADQKQGEFVKEMPAEPAGEQFEDGECLNCGEGPEECVCKHVSPSEYDKSHRDMITQLATQEEVSDPSARQAFFSNLLPKLKPVKDEAQRKLLIIQELKNFGLGLGLTDDESVERILRDVEAFEQSEV